MEYSVKTSTYWSERDNAANKQGQEQHSGRTANFGTSVRSTEQIFKGKEWVARADRLKKATTSERLPAMVMRCQTSAPVSGVKSVVATFRGCANYPFNGWL